jgi:hypothetical protein
MSKKTLIPALGHNSPSPIGPQKLARRISSLFLRARPCWGFRLVSLSEIFRSELLEGVAYALVGSLARHLLKAQRSISQFIGLVKRHHVKVKLIS